MEVVLLEKQSMGGLGDKVIVKDGFARNFLFPQKKAVPATKANIEKFEAMRADLEKQQAEKVSQAQVRADALEKLSIVIKANAGEEGKLFGSVGTQDIADAITAAGCAVEKSEVQLPDGALRQLGEFEVNLHLHSDVNAIVKIEVAADE